MRIIRVALTGIVMLASFLGSWRLYYRPGDLDAALPLYGLALAALWLGAWENYSYLNGAWAEVRPTWALRPFNEDQGRLRSGQALRGRAHSLLPYPAG